MRIILAAAAALAALTVSGCDIDTGPPKTAKVECNCAQPPQSAAALPPDMRGSTAYPPPARHYRWHGRRYAGGVHGYYWRREYAELSVSTYDYHSDSHSYYQGDRGGSAASAYAYAGAAAYAGGASYGGAAVHGGDGFTRVEGGATIGAPTHYETHADDRARLHPWHGYDADCPDQDRH
ncbi:MAG TPA: hypothetical protein VNU97_04390 [Rhizomicrobium sp.]|jgi:hypothetical protein|nr:hypothetical protein [Rhizomicrobium sp.]